MIYYYFVHIITNIFIINLDIIGTINVNINNYSESELQSGVVLDLSLEPAGNGTIQFCLNVVPTVIPMRSSMNELYRRSEVQSGDQRD